MPDSLSLTILPQFVETTDEVYGGRPLHHIQEALLHYDKLPTFTIITAPTGTGKSFAFPLPIVQHRQSDSFSTLRCVIVSPTNALIEDMEREYKEKFPDLRVTKLNREKLNEFNAKGPARWDALFEVLTANEVIITNPDLLNFAMFGGYARHKGQHEITQIFARVGYFIFDEYHLYDEEQIANIISWIIFARATAAGRGNKFIFASATAEPGLVDVLRQQGFEPAEIIEQISDRQTPSSRAIHGTIEVTFIKGTTPQDYLLQNSDSVRRWIRAGDKVLVIFDRMIDLRSSRNEIELEFDDVAVAEESGYLTKSKIREDTVNANLILGTNKVEVGVNLNVTTCLMQTGKHFANFVQRFGRVARDGKDGRVLVFLDGKIKEIERAFAGLDKIAYYDFIERCRTIELLSDRKFYTEKVPRYLGAYFHMIARSLKDYATRELFKASLTLEGETKYMYGLMRSIEAGIWKDLRLANKDCGFRYTRSDLAHWQQWWKIFSGTFKYFRASKPDVLIRDLTYKDGCQLTRYSLEWILRNREVIGIEDVAGEQCYVVSGLRECRDELQYRIESFPIYKVREDTLILHQSEKYSLKEAFEKRVCQVADIYRGGDLFRQTATRLLIDKVLKLKPIITEKRLAITDIRGFSNII
jgi:CRISPR-associated endonuclease/helicase Cas3